MEINVIVHNDENKQALFGLIGEVGMSLEVHKSVGAPIVSANGDTWIVATWNGDLVGMCAVRPLKSKASAKLHGLYAFDDAKVATRLRKEAVKVAKKLDAKELVITDKADLAPTYQKEGWEVLADRGIQFKTYRMEVAS